MSCGSVLESVERLAHEMGRMAARMRSKLVITVSLLNVLLLALVDRRKLPALMTRMANRVLNCGHPNFQ